MTLGFVGSVRKQPAPLLKRRLDLFRATIVIALAGCSHTAAFEEDPPDRSAGPHGAVPPVQLTFNPLQDISPGFFPSVPGIVYTYESSAPGPRDRCLGIIPPMGGTRIWQACAGTGGSLDSLDAYGPAALSPGGRLAYVASASSELKRGPDRSVLVLATLAAPLDTTRIHTFPINVDGVKVDGITDPHWLDDQHLVYVAQRVDFPRYCNGCDRDTVRTGLGIVMVDLSGPPVMSLVGGPRFVTSLAIADDGAFIYTMAGDSRVFRESPPGGAASVVYDFGSEGMARGIDVRGTLLAAIVGLKGSFIDWPGLGLTVFDSGGIVQVVDLATNATVFRSYPPTTAPWIMPDSNLFRRAVFVSDDALVVEGLPITLSTRPTGEIDSVMLLRPGDLWRVQFRP